MKRSSGSKRTATLGGIGESLVQSGLDRPAAKSVEDWLSQARTRKTAAKALRRALAPASVEVVPAGRPQRVIILPSRARLRSTAADTSKFLAEMVAPSAVSASVPPVRMKVLDSIHEDGAKLVEATPDELQKLRAAQPGLLVVPERFYKTAVSRHGIESSVGAASGTHTALRSVAIEITSRLGGKAMAGATVVAFTNFATRTGAQGVTSSKGTVTLKLPATVKKLDRVYVYTEGAYWGAYRKNLVLSSSTVKILIDAIDLGVDDDLRYFCGAGDLNDGTGVKVAVVDTGIALHHPDLHVVGGECTVSGESKGDYGPLGGDHGSHCAGIIAGRGTAPQGMRGVAPGAALYSFRVFPTVKPGQESGASNFAIAKAIDRAAAAGCDLLNLSLGGGDPDPATEAAIEDARNAGAVVIAAAGNNDRSPVSFPAAFDLCVAVSALGRKGLSPAGSICDGDVAGPYGKDKKDFIASFSNIGTEIDCTGPGVGVVSTVPPADYTVMSGTSMAAPAVTGLAARMLGRNQALLTAARDSQRANAIVKALLASAQPLGFGAKYEGQGLPAR